MERKKGALAYDCELSTQEAETGRLRVEGWRETLPKNKTKQDKTKQTELVQNNSTVSKGTVAHLSGVWGSSVHFLCTAHLL